MTCANLISPEAQRSEEIIMGVFSKGAQTRLDETRDYIVSKITDGGEKARIKSYITTKITQLAGPSGVVKGISDPMSMNDLTQRGTKDERKQRRSLIMIELMGGMSVGMSAKTLAATGLAAKFAESLESLRWVVDQESGTGMVIAQPFNELKNNTLQFLSKYPLLVFGSETDGKMHQYFIYEKPTTPNMPHKFAFYSKSMHKHYAHSPKVSVSNVPGVVWSKVPGRGSNSTSGSFATIDGTECTESIMLTTQFSGCCFCYKTHGGKTFAAHIMPGDESKKGSDITGGGKTLAEQLAGLHATTVTPGDFKSPPAPTGGQFYVYGRDYSNIPGQTGYTGGVQMTLIGIRRGGTWNFYSQEVVAGNVSSATQIV